VALSTLPPSAAPLALVCADEECPEEARQAIQPLDCPLFLAAIQATRSCVMTFNSEVQLGATL